MHNDDDDDMAILCHEAIKLGLKIRPSHLGSLHFHLKHIGGKLSRADVAAKLPSFARKSPNFFEGGVANETLEQRLERSNAMLAEQAAQKAPTHPNSVPLTDAERQQLAKLPNAAARNDWVNVRNAAMLDAAKKKKNESA